MEKANEKKHEARARLEKIDDEIAEKNAEIKRLSEELDDINKLRRRSDQTYEKILDYWKGEKGFKKLYDANEERTSIFTALAHSAEEAMEKAKAEKKRLINEMEDIRCF